MIEDLEEKNQQLQHHLDSQKAQLEQEISEKVEESQ